LGLRILPGELREPLQFLHAGRTPCTPSQARLGGLAQVSAREVPIELDLSLLGHLDRSVLGLPECAGEAVGVSGGGIGWITPGHRRRQVHLDIMMLRCQTLVMRTTLHLDDDVYEAVKSLAAIDRSSVGKILSRLARRALNPARPATSSRGFPVFSVPPDARPLTPDMVRDALDET